MTNPTAFFLSLFIASGAILASVGESRRLHYEKEYQTVWCEKERGITEYRLSDGTRVDCLTREYAVEFDFAEKWAESVGQSIYYAMKTGKKPGVVLIMENKNDNRHLARLKMITAKYNIKLWIMTTEDL